MNILNEYTHYLNLIKEYSLYSDCVTEKPPLSFTYECKIDKQALHIFMPELSKEEYENEWEHLIGILKWVKMNLPHDGYNNYEMTYDAISIIKFMRERQIGPSCMMLSFALRDILESYGYCARIVQTCPFDFTILDSHWKVLVFSNDYNKWIMLDPSWCAYCIKDGIPLSIQEIRNMLVQNEEFEIINHSGLSKGHYHYLLCRYYFHFNSFEYNGIGMFERDNQKRINLAPVGFDSKAYFEQRYKLEEPDMKDWMKAFLNVHRKNTIVTNHEYSFWKEPNYL